MIKLKLCVYKTIFLTFQTKKWVSDFKNKTQETEQKITETANSSFKQHIEVCFYVEVFHNRIK